jgi:two-component system sensor histidine kinase MprB
MTLRLRLTLIIGTVVVIAVAVASWIAYLNAADRLTGEIDRFLEARADRATQPVSRRPGSPIDDRGPGGGFDPIVIPRRGGIALTEFDALTQALDGDGAIFLSFPPDTPLPVDASDVEVATGVRTTTLRTVDIDDVRYRLITAPIASGGALQIARSLAETDRVLASLRTRFLIIGALGTAVAAASVWIVARRASRPIELLAHRAQQVAVTEDLSTPLDVRAPGEVGQLASSFNAMLTALATSKMQQQRLVQDAGHELRTPLTSLRTNIELLDRIDELDADDRAGLIEDLRAESVELSKLVEEIVELATDHRRSEIPGPLDLRDSARDVAMRATRRSGREVNVSVGDRCVAMVRPSQFERALSNLVDNALKFSDGAVEIAIERSPSDITMTVRDHGPGLDGSDLPHVFDRFWRADTSRSTPGSGLGLAIVAQFAADHGGTVFAGNAPDGGARIGFRLPGDLAKDQQVPGNVVAEQSEPTPGDERGV